MLSFIGQLSPRILEPWIRASLHHEPWSQIMEDGLLPWSDLMFHLPWSNSLKKSIYKPLGPSLGVNRMWTKRNHDHAPKNECVDFFDIYAQKGWIRGKQSLTIFLSSLVLIFSSMNKISLQNYYEKFICHVPMSFYTRAFFASPTTKPIGPC